MEFKKNINCKINIDIDKLYRVIIEDIMNNEFNIKKDYEVKEFLEKFILNDTDYLEDNASFNCQNYESYEEILFVLSYLREDITKELLKKFKNDDITIIKDNVKMHEREVLKSDIRRILTNKLLNLSYYDKHSKKEIAKIFEELLDEFDIVNN